MIGKRLEVSSKYGLVQIIEMTMILWSYRWRVEEVVQISRYLSLIYLWHTTTVGSGPPKLYHCFYVSWVDSINHLVDFLQSYNVLWAFDFYCTSRQCWHLTSFFFRPIIQWVESINMVLAFNWEGCLQSDNIVELWFRWLIKTVLTSSIKISMLHGLNWKCVWCAIIIYEIFVILTTRIKTVLTFI